jgi:hypothetical protein
MSIKAQINAEQGPDPLQAKLKLLEKDLSEAQAIITALTDLLHIQNRELRYMQIMARRRSLGKKIIYSIKRMLRQEYRALTPVPQTGDSQSLNHSEFHPGIQVRLKAASFWQRYVIPISRKLRGKLPRNKYDVYVVSLYDTDGNAGSAIRTLAKRYAAILERRGL